jgi:hypothetical protein
MALPRHDTGDDTVTPGTILRQPSLAVVLALLAKKILELSPLAPRSTRHKIQLAVLT